MEEEEEVLQSYFSPSTVNQSLVIDLDQLSNQEIKEIIADWLPNQIIKIGPFYFYYLLAELYPFDIWNQLIYYFTYYSDIYCRKQISNDYIYSNFLNKSKLVVICTTYDSKLYEKHKIDLINGIFLAGFSENHSSVEFGSQILDKDDAYIVATCFREIGKIKIKLGLFMRCLGMSILKRLGKKNIYTEALNEYLSKYYHSLGFESTGSKVVKCSDVYLNEDLSKETFFMRSTLSGFIFHSPFSLFVH